MARMIIVYDTSQRSAREIGRAFLNSDGSATVRGFNPGLIAQYQENGIPDLSGDGEDVPLTEGNRFLDLFLKDWDGSYIRAREDNGTPAVKTTRLDPQP
jgi:hypothetical protein